MLAAALHSEYHDDDEFGCSFGEGCYGIDWARNVADNLLAGPLAAPPGDGGGVEGSEDYGWPGVEGRDGAPLPADLSAIASKTTDPEAIWLLVEQAWLRGLAAGRADERAAGGPLVAAVDAFLDTEQRFIAFDYGSRVDAAVKELRRVRGEHRG